MPETEPLLSAVVLTYRKGWILSRFLASLARQTRRPDQVVVVDDASDDGTVRALEAIPATYEIVRLPVNRGQSHARNVGVEKSTGNLIAFLDGDIEMREDMLQVLEDRLLGTRSASFAYGHYERRGALRGSQRAKPWDPGTLCERNFISAMSLVWKAHLPVPPFDETLRRLEDWDLWLTMAAAGRKGIMVDRCLFDAYYRKGDVTPSAGEIVAREKIGRKHGLFMKACSP